jgi:hypothetical protein
MQKYVVIKNRYTCEPIYTHAQPTVDGNPLCEALGQSGYLARFDLADLKFANLAGLKCMDMHLAMADLTGAILFDVDMTGAQLEGASLEAARAQGAYLPFSTFQNAFMPQANCTGANLHGVYFHGAHLDSTDFGSADLEGAVFTYADVKGCNFAGSNIEMADLRDVKADLFFVLTHFKDLAIPLREVVDTGIGLQLNEYGSVDLLATLANLPGADADALERVMEPGHWQERTASAALFRNISPENYHQGAEANPVISIFLGWIDEFVLMSAPIRKPSATIDRDSELRAGNDAVNQLMDVVNTMVWDADEASEKTGDDETDYKRMGERIESVLSHHMLVASEAQREGFVRGLICHLFEHAHMGAHGRDNKHTLDGIEMTARAYGRQATPRSMPVKKTKKHTAQHPETA